jgi:uncharacterized protein involved in outer membrane biogenesis
MKKTLIRIVIGLGVLLIVALVVVFFSLNSIVKKGVETVGPQITKVDVKLGSANLSPFGGSGQLSKLFVGNPEGFKTPSAIQVGDVKVKVKIGSVLKDTIVVEEVNIQAPEITLEGGLTGNNLMKILDNISGTEKEQKQEPVAAKKSEKKICVKQLVIDGGKINLSVNGLMVGKSMTVPLPPVHLQNIGSEENGVTSAELAKEIMKPVLASAMEAATKALASGGKELQDLGKGVTKGTVDEVGKAAKGIGDLFKKK